MMTWVSLGSSWEPRQFYPRVGNPPQQLAESPRVTLPGRFIRNQPHRTIQLDPTTSSTRNLKASLNVRRCYPPSVRSPTQIIPH